LFADGIFALVRRLVLRCDRRRLLRFEIFLDWRLLRRGIGGLWSLWSLGWRLVSFVCASYFIGVSVIMRTSVFASVLLRKSNSNSKDLTQSAQRVGGEHRGTNGARFTAEMQRKVGEILRCAQDEDASRLMRWIIAGGRLAIGRGSRLLGWPGSGCLCDRACRRGPGAGRRNL